MPKHNKKPILIVVLFLLVAGLVLGLYSFYKNSELRILAVGDMFFDRNIRRDIRNKGSDYVFACAAPLFEKIDFAIGNLEGPITEYASVSEGSVVGSPDNFRFTFPTSTATVLSDHNFRVVSLGNNHINNFGISGMKSTAKFLDDAGVGYFGGIRGNEPIYRMEEKGYKLSFVSYNEFGGDDSSTVARKIATESKDGRRVIVFSHWGDEYSKNVSRLRPIATKFAESGASVVLGSHPHVIMPHEMIGNVPVYYSLGNFIFDQYFSDDVKEGQALILHMTKEGVSVDEKRVSIKKGGQTCLKS